MWCTDIHVYKTLIQHFFFKAQQHLLVAVRNLWEVSEDEIHLIELCMERLHLVGNLKQSAMFAEFSNNNNNNKSSIRKIQQLNCKTCGYCLLTMWLMSDDNFYLI